MVPMIVRSLRVVLDTARNAVRQPLIARWRRPFQPGQRAMLVGLVLVILGGVGLVVLGQSSSLRFRGGLVESPRTDLQKHAAGVDANRGDADSVPESLVAVSIPGESGGVPWSRRIVRQAMVELTMADIDRGVSRAMDVVEAAGGFVAGTDAQTDATGTYRATLTAYVPTDRLARVLADLDTLGRMTRRQVSGHDVSEEFVDLEARVRNLERHEGQLLAFMGRAQKVSDLLSLENELARVRGEIERLTGRIRFLKARTEMATIQIGLVRAPLAAPDDGVARVWEQIRVAFRDGWSMAFRVLATVAVAAAQSSPLLVPLGAAWALYRRWARRRAIAAPASPSGTAG
jgi:Domain of unknown function (DUF4349)